MQGSGFIVTTVPDLRVLLLRLERHGLTIEQIAEECDVHRNCISKIRRGATKDPGYRLGKAIERLACQHGETL